MATVEKIRKDIEKTKEKISAQQKRLRELEEQLTEEENLEIVRMVKAVRMDNKELTAFLKAYASGLITLPDGMMEAEAAADPDDADVEGMEDGEVFNSCNNRRCCLWQKTKEMNLDAAVERAVDECIQEGILEDFLRANRAEVLKVSIFESAFSLTETFYMVHL